MRWCALVSARAAMRDCQGTTALEFAFVAPLLLAMLLGTMDFGRWLLTAAALDYAVAQAARCATVSPKICASAAAIAQVGARAAAAGGIEAAAFNVAVQPCGILVQAHWRYRALVPTLAPLAPTINARACGA